MSWTGQLVKQPNTSSIYGQHITSSGQLFWGNLGLDVCVEAGVQKAPELVVNDGGAAIACWEDARNDTSQIYAMRINEDMTRYVVSGSVRDMTGTGLTGVALRADSDGKVDVEGVVTTDSTGQYSFETKPYWGGTLAPEPRGYLNVASPPFVRYSDLLGDVVGNYTVSHLKTVWKVDGLEVTPGTSAALLPSVCSDGTGGVFLTWEDERGANETGSDVYVQRIDPTGDLQWTIGGDPLVQTVADDKSPKTVLTATGEAIVVYVSGDSLRAQRLGTDGFGRWGAEGIPLGNTGVVTHFGVTTDGVDGAYVIWETSVYNWPDEMYAQRITSAGNLWWSSPALVANWSDAVEDPMVMPDGQNGVVVCWQQEAGGGSTSIEAQRLDFAGSQLWNGGQAAVGVRSYTYIPEHKIVAAPDGNGGLYVGWTECRDSLSSNRRVTRVQWVTPEGVTHWQAAAGPDTGFAVITTPDYHDLLDLAVDEEAGFFVLFNRWITGLCGQNIVPDPSFQNEERKWGDEGKTVAGQVYSPAARIIDSGAGTGGVSIVVWREDGPRLYAQKLSRNGSRMWNTDKVAVWSGSYEQYQLYPLAVVGDEAGGAIVAWNHDGGIYATRVNDQLMAHVGVEIATKGRKPNGHCFSLEDTAAVGCPQGDQDHIVVSLALTGDMMSSIPKEAITLSPPSDSAVCFFGLQQADSAPVLIGGVHRTTITVESFNGCGRDSAMVKLYGAGRGYAHFNVKSQDLERISSNGRVELLDFADFGSHFPSSICDCRFEHPYDKCVDFAPPQDTTVDIIDFASFSPHFGHYYQTPPGGQSSPAIAYSSGSVELHFEEDYPLRGERTLKGAVSLKNVEPYSVIFLSFKSTNPIFTFKDWHQSANYRGSTMCTEVLRNGQREIVLGVLGSKKVDTYAVNLGAFEVRVSSDQPLTLTESDFALMTADLLELGGGTRVFKGSQAYRDLAPTVFRNHLAQNYPNPFNPTTTIAFSIAKVADVDLAIYDVTGALVKRLVRDRLKMNNYKFMWDGRNNSGNPVASGVYFCRLITADFKATKKMIMLR